MDISILCSILSTGISAVLCVYIYLLQAKQNLQGLTQELYHLKHEVKNLNDLKTVFERMLVNQDKLIAENYNNSTKLRDELKDSLNAAIKTQNEFIEKTNSSNIKSKDELKTSIADISKNQYDLIKNNIKPDDIKTIVQKIDSHQNVIEDIKELTAKMYLNYSHSEDLKRSDMIYDMKNAFETLKLTTEANFLSIKTVIDASYEKINLSFEAGLNKSSTNLKSKLSDSIAKEVKLFIKSDSESNILLQKVLERVLKYDELVINSQQENLHKELDTFVQTMGNKLNEIQVDFNDRLNSSIIKIQSGYDLLPSAQSPSQVN